MDDDFYCHVCHRSDERGRKHVYTKKHKERVNAALRKFEAKMQPAKQCVLSGPTILKCDPPEVVDKFWCPFCLAEVKKHERLGQIIAHFKSWAEHLCSEEHHKRVHEFFWTNKLDMKKRDKYKLNQEKLESLEDKSKKNLDKFTEDSLQAIKEEASRIREVEKRRSVLQAGSSAQSKPGSEIDSFDSELCSLEGDGKRIPASVTIVGGRAIHHSNPVRNTVNPHPYDGSTRYHPGREMNSSNANIVQNKIRHDTLSSSTPHTMRHDWNLSSEERNISHGPPPWAGTSYKDLCDTPGPSVMGVTDSSSYRPVRQVYRTDNRLSPESSNSSHTNIQRDQRASTSSSRLSVVNQDKASSSVSSGPGSFQPEIDPLLKVKTARVISSGGLTVISRKKSNLRGNVHTGSVPPWLQEEGGSHDDTPTVVIGPTAEDLQKHLENERKRKLNPKRVGANFDHSSETPDEWLPSFGRVWNHGPRWRSRKQYKKEVDGKLKKGNR
ncbi:centrosomal AT-AC splicing factor-like [Apostichopus japonicus]|uniref:centrosomal AT-AC splicing factor-like n=1 Tax=Stichopus japonicus TaxID=307972 RepID=UPI003AB3854E